MYSIEVNSLVKNYEEVKAVKGISFKVKEKAFFALLGPNGAGKSTTIEILSTLLQQTAGGAMVDQHKLGENDEAIRNALGVVFQYTTLDDTLTLEENLKLRSAFYKMDHKTYLERIKTLDETIHFNDFFKRQLKTLSGGQRRKADIARALLHQPKILILDEPTTGLDPKSRKEIWQLIMKIKEATNMTILLTTHYMEEVLDADHVIIMNEGIIVAEDSAENLRIKYAKDQLKITAKKTLEQKLNHANIPYKKNNSTLIITLKDSFEGLDYVNTFKEDIETFEIVKASMDDVFLNITGRKLGGE